MSIQISNSQENQSRRLGLKTMNQQMSHLAVHGAGLSPWEAKELVKMIDEVYFSYSQKELKEGQLKYNCVSAKEGAGKPLKDCEMISVTLSIFCNFDEESLPNKANKQRQVLRRQRRLLRLSDEAKDQGGLLSQEDLAKLLMCDTKTIRRDVKHLRTEGVIIPTRGQQKDIGPGVTHRELVIRHWVEGKEEVEVASATKHSMGAIENYLQKFKIAVYLRVGKSFTDHEISVVAGISQRAVKTFLNIYEEFKHKDMFKHRLDEILLTGDEYYKEVGEKKDSLQSNLSKPVWSRA
jgi:biotin operon repressor